MLETFALKSRFLLTIRSKDNLIESLKFNNVNNNNLITYST